MLDTKIYCFISFHFQSPNISRIYYHLNLKWKPEVKLDSISYRDYDWISKRFLSVYVRVRSCNNLKSSPSSVIFITSVTFHFWWRSSVAHVRKVCHGSNRDSSDILWNEIRVADVACSVRNNISRKTVREKRFWKQLSHRF